MIEVENIKPYGFETAIMAMRNPMNSWDKSDSYGAENRYVIGNNDLDLMRRLYKAGVEHRTYARMIQVSMDITAPLYWWKEMDRYTVGKTQISTSTMHKITAKEFKETDFSIEKLVVTVEDEEFCPYDTFLSVMDELNFWRKEYFSYDVDTKGLTPKEVQMAKKNCWWQMIQLLPTSYNQRRTVLMSYEVVFKIIKERTGHKLDEWNEFCDVLRDLPYVKEIMNGSDDS